MVTLPWLLAAFLATAAKQGPGGVITAGNNTQPNDGFNDVELLRKQYNGLHAYNLLIDFSGK